MGVDKIRRVSMRFGDLEDIVMELGIGLNLLKVKKKK